MTDINKNVQYISLYVDTLSAHSSPRVYVKQYDAKSRFISATIKDRFGRVTVTGVAQLNAQKPDGTFCYSRCVINDDSTVTAELPTQMIAAPGDVKCDISFFTTDDLERSILTTQTFIVTVQESNYDSDAIESSNEYSVVTENLLKTEKNCQLAISAAEEAKQGKEAIEAAKQEAVSAAASASDSAANVREMTERCEEAAKTVDTIRENAETARKAAESAVRFDETQSLESWQKQQARANIGADFTRVTYFLDDDHHDDDITVILEEYGAGVVMVGNEIGDNSAARIGNKNASNAGMDFPLLVLPRRSFSSVRIFDAIDPHGQIWRGSLQVSTKKITTLYKVAPLNIPGARPGQVVKVKAVDDDNFGDCGSVPTELEAADSRVVYTATLPALANSWTSDDNGFYIDLAVSGLAETDTPIIDLTIDTSKDIAAQEENWSNVYKATASENTLRVYATAVPSTDLTMKAMVIK